MKPRANENSCYGIILLAAGSSRRMGATNKLLTALPIGPSESLLLRSAKQVLHNLNRGYHDGLQGYLSVVTGYAHCDVQRELNPLSVECDYNPCSESGMASSLQVGLQSLCKQAGFANKHLDFIIVCLADMPHVRSETIAQIINARLRDTNRDFIVPVFNDQRGNPVLIGHAFFDAMKQLSGDVGARKLIQENPVSTFELRVSDPGVLKDYDLPSDFD
ncbi:nucleotidyltransferase family protein [Granulosicoccus sp.]|nr:nucleotidyltransferase family protein [Granulosicoccus sp.]MDB4222639.1 nucleotidyltransferase family protein [Granulosicoccus sp.]